MKLIFVKILVANEEGRIYLKVEMRVFADGFMKGMRGRSESQMTSKILARLSG